MELLQFLLDGSQSLVAKHVQTLLYALLGKGNMVDEVSYLIYFLVERCYGVEKWLDFFIIATVMVIIWIFLFTGLVFISLFLGGHCLIL